jgi:hypothetical protein
MPTSREGNTEMKWTTIYAICTALLVVTHYAARAEDKIYKSVDELGVTTYSNVQPAPGVEAIDMPDISVIPARDVSTMPMRDPMQPLQLSENTFRESKQEDRGRNIYNVFILKPEHNDTVPITGSAFEVELDVQPPLDVEAGHRIEIILDGAVTTETQDTEVRLPGLDRGSHQLMARVVTDSDEVVRSSDTITFYAQQPVVSQNNAER